jgi:hypothetical protein
MPGDGRYLGAPETVPHLRPRRLLRRFEEPARDPALQGDAAPIIDGYDPPEGSGGCYLDVVVLDLFDRKTPHNGPISRYY